jgi:hypothetical protein
MKARRGTKGETIQARVTANEKVLLQAYADRQGITTSDVVRKLVSELILVLQRQKDSSPTSVGDNGAGIGGR